MLFSVTMQSMCFDYHYSHVQGDAAEAVNELLRKYSAAASIDESVRTCVEDQLVQASSK